MAMMVMMAVHWGEVDHQKELYHSKPLHCEGENVSNVLVTSYAFTSSGLSSYTFGMRCLQWSALFEKYNTAVRIYSGIVKGANGLRGIEFHRVQDLASKAKLACLDAETALQQHERSHRCMDPQSVHFTSV